MTMIDEHQINGAVARLERLFEEKLSLRRGGFEARARRARYRLPRRLRADLTRLLEARRLAGHPRLARMVDAGALLGGVARIEAHLKSIDTADLRRGRLLALTGRVMGNLLLVFAVLIGVMLWRGFL